MKSTGIVRQVDKLGRIVIPIELRRSLLIGEKDALEIFTQDDTIVLRRYTPLCYLCSSGDELKSFKNRNICGRCVSDAKRL